jgi:hypothetical protein
MAELDQTTVDDTVGRLPTWPRLAEQPFLVSYAPMMPYCVGEEAAARLSRALGATLAHVERARCKAGGRGKA